MRVRTEVSATFNCSLERAFKTPILGDATKFLNGYLLQPPVSGFENDETWGKINGVRYPVTEGNWMVRKGQLFKDEVLNRVENKYWQWTIYDFQLKNLFFVSKAVGEWYVYEHTKNDVEVHYIYTYYSKHWLTYPLTWLFSKIQIKGMMKQAIEGIKAQAESNSPYIYNN